MRRLPYILLCLWALCMLIGCAGDGYTPALRTADSLMNDSPSVALAMLDSLKGEAQGWSKAQRMRYHLLTMKAQNKAYVDFTSDSLAKDVVEYYDNHGTANDRLLAHYLLGCVYRDLGESPEALQAYYDAISVADTATADCDMSTLASVYGQMSQIFHQQDLPHDEVWAWQNYSKFIKETGGAKDYIIAKSQLIRPYYLLGEKDSVLKIISDSYQSLKLMGYTQDAAEMLPTAIYIYTERKDLLVARQMIDIYERESGLFDGNGNIARGREHYYVTKGFFKLAINEMDSAENCFRNAIQSGYLSDGYKGLLSVYRHKNVLDSIVHFSLLYEAAQDSLHDNMQMETIHRMSALFNYNRYQKESSERAKQVYGIRIILILVSILFVLIVVFSVAIGRRFIKRQREKESIQKRIHEQDQERLRRIHLEKEEELRQTHHQELEQLEKDYQQRQTELRKEHERNHKTLIEKHHQEQEDWLQYQKQKEQEVDSLKEEIAHLRLPENVANSEALMDAPIVKTIIELANKPVRPITKDEWRQLGKTIGKYCPQLIDDLNQQNASKDMIKVCFLTVLNVRHNEQAALMDLNKQDVTNIKTSLNRKIFGEKTSRTIYQNLLNRYHIYSL